MARSDRPYRQDSQRAEEQEKNEIAVREDAPDKHVNEADNKEEEEHAEDDIGHIEEGRRKIVSSTAKRYIVDEA